jgi:hypothetical protein
MIKKLLTLLALTLAFMATSSHGRAWQGEGTPSELVIGTCIPSNYRLSSPSVLTYLCGNQPCGFLIPCDDPVSSLVYTGGTCDEGGEGFCLQYSGEVNSYIKRDCVCPDPFGNIVSCGGGWLSRGGSATVPMCDQF